MPSSQIPVIEASLWLNRLFMPRGVYDIRFVGFISIMLHLLAVGLILRGTRPLKRNVRIVFALVFTFAFTDVGYVSYYNSFFSEQASLLGLLLSVGIVLLMMQTRGLTQFLLVIPFTLAIIYFSMSKVQNFIVGALMALLIIRWMILIKPWWQRISIGVFLAIAIVFSLSMYWSNPPFAVRHSLHNTVFAGILRNDPHPEATLKELGLPPSFKKYQGLDAFEPGSPLAARNRTFMQIFFSRASFKKVIEYYLHHPMIFLQKFLVVAKQAHITHVPFLGNFEKSDKHPILTKAKAFSWWSSLKGLLPKRFWFMLLLLGTGMGSVGFFYWKFRDNTIRLGLDFLVVLLLLACSQYPILVIGDGLEGLVDRKSTV